MVPARAARRLCELLALPITTAGFLSGSARHANAQEQRSPEDGGRTYSLGQPQRWHWQAGIGAGAYFAGPSTDLTLRVVAGGYHTTLNPVTELAELGTEVYGGVRGRNADGGVRGIFQVPYLSAGIGADYNLRDQRLDLLVTLHTPVRRGGLLTRGTLLRLDWYPLRSHSFTIGVSAPLADPLAGRDRPIQEFVVVAGNFPTPASHHAIDSILFAELDSLQVSADWLRRLTVPFLDQDGRNAGIALARTSHFGGMLGEHLGERSVETEVRFFHRQLEDVFTVASGSRAAGTELARHGRAILLEEILLPYDALVGRQKRHDTLRTLSVAARGRFGQWVTSSGAVPPDRLEEVLFAFQRVTEIFESERRQAAKEWDDPRLVWLPLQYAILPEEADDQAELDSLIERVTGLSFTDRNRITYAANLQFHWELLQMIKETQNYHVLWIHDFPATTKDSGLDWASLEVVQGYLAALTDRVRQYDSTRTLPSYFIFLDQYYYEGRKSRLWMSVLEDPLRASTSLPFGSHEHRAALTESLQRLRTAVLDSRVLQAEAREYGDDWLRNRIKVHVNITNRVDASFWGGGLISTVFGYPDDVMRDHRKIAFRDVSEDDPFDGVAILTGMGVGQRYLGPGWDDRALIIQGPVLLQLKRAARELLLSQGLVEADLPVPFRPRLLADDALARLAARPDAARFDARALMLLNGTGYLPKPLNAAKALLYSMMPRGSVIKVPDSLWNSTFYAGLLLGACLRGAHVLIIAPAHDNAPSTGFPQMERAYELLTRLLMVRGQLREAIAAAGGELRIGLYALPVDQRGFASRAERWVRQIDSTSFLRSLMPFAPAVEEVVGDASRDSTGHEESPEPPKLHQKVQFLATGEFWRAVTASPEWPRFMATYLRYRRATYSPSGRYTEARYLPDTLNQIATRLFASADTTPRAASFAFLGSQNQDYRGMFMDGEVGVVFTGAASLVPLVDLVFMVGTVTWIDDQATLDRLLPPVGELRRRIARVTKDGV